MIKSFLQGFRTANLIKKTIKAKNYYDHIDELPVYNFFKIRKGEYQYLYKDEKLRDGQYPEALFKMVFREMYFQFKELDNTFLRELATLEDYKSKIARTKMYENASEKAKHFRWKNEYNTLAKKVEKEVVKELDLDDFTDTIERTFNNPVGSLDVFKVSTSKAFNNYNRAVKQIKNSSRGNTK
jgi:hypothetical protein